MPTTEPTQIDQLLETLTGVLRARVRYSDDEERLSEIHVLSDGAVAPKQIVRNIETAIKTAFDLTIDHRVVSIAVLKEGVQVEDEDGALDLSSSADDGQGTGHSSPRVVFRKLRVLQEEPLKCTAYVALELDDVIFEGSHRDTDTPRARVYSSARAVIEALEYLAEKEMAFYLAGLESLHVFQKDVLVVMIEGRQRRDQRRMLGSAVVNEDPQEAAVRAVLDAVNRFMSRPGASPLPSA
ncbi:MAG: hypothetical protein R3326_07845 [Gemmatimonadota bacterium]|nr:hypothetical protein [Gemmatimonadota bacterium]